MQKGDKIYFVLAGLFISVLLITNVVGTKLFQPFGLTINLAGNKQALLLTSGIIAYPITFFMTDLVSEIYGKKRADFMVILGFCFSLVLMGFINLVSVLPTPNADFQNAYETVFSSTFRLIFGSMLAYTIAQLNDNFLFHFIRRLTKGKHLWLRNTASTATSQLLDTATVNTIFFYNNPATAAFVPNEDIIIVILANYIFKFLIAMTDTPFVYIAVYYLRKYLGLKGYEHFVSQNK